MEATSNAGESRLCCAVRTIVAETAASMHVAAMRSRIARAPRMFLSGERVARGILATLDGECAATLGIETVVKVSAA